MFAIATIAAALLPSIHMARAQDYVGPPAMTATGAEQLSRLGHSPPPDPVIELDEYPPMAVHGTGCDGPVSMDAMGWHILPPGFIYRAYLAGVKESRLAAHFVTVKDDNTFMDGTLGGRFGVFRYGTSDPMRPQGFQIDVEGSGQVRLDIPDEVDVRAADFRAGCVGTFGDRRHQTKFGYYHLSSHVGDEYLIKHPGHNRLNYARDVLVLGHSIFVTDSIRVYGEAGWSFFEDVSQQWEFQFGVEQAPMVDTGVRGAPFWAINGHLREEVNFGGNFVFQAGWAWRSGHDGSLVRLGLHYYNGESSQFSFFDDFEEQIGLGLWYDY